VDWVGEWTTDPGDEQILDYAKNAGRVLVTIDKDFGELAVVRGLPHAGIIRIVGFAAQDQAVASVAALEQYAAELTAGALVTVERHRVRVRPAENPEGGSHDLPQP
jgi:predicted nuclease of predicted toxin-antitoxin system